MIGFGSHQNHTKPNRITPTSSCGGHGNDGDGGDGDGDGWNDQNGVLTHKNNRSHVNLKNVVFWSSPLLLVREFLKKKKNCTYNIILNLINYVKTAIVNSKQL